MFRVIKVFRIVRSGQVCTHLAIRRNLVTTPKLPRPSRKQNDGSVGYLMLAVPITTFALGTWQVQRRTWKLNLIKELEEKTTAEPIDLPQDIRNIADLEYRRVRLRGHFDYSQEMYLAPRSLVEPGREMVGGGLISAGNRSTVGLWVITPFELADRKERILVNRGWIPRSALGLAGGHVQGHVEIVGVVRKTEQRPPFGSKNDFEKQEWHQRDLDGLATKLNTLPVFVDIDASSTVPGGPIGGQTRISLRNEHLSYIATWYGLFIFTSYLWYLKFYKRLRVV